MAHSSVALYGLIDTGIAHIDNVGGSSSTRMRSGSLYSSRFGFRGTEDLGGGLKAVFNLESGVNTATGAASTPYFNRQSWVSLRSASFGELTMGRMLPTISELFVASVHASHFGNPAAAIDGAAIGAGSSAARFNNMLGGTRVDSAIKYQTPSLAGFKIHAMVAAFGEVPGSTSAGRMLSVGGSYTSEHIDAGLAYHERRCTEVGGCAAGQDKDKIMGLGVTYKLKGGRYAAIYTRQKNALNVQGNDADTLSLLALVPLNAQWIVKGGFQYLNDRTPLNQDIRQLNLGGSYLLSKRTQIYALYSRQTVKNGGKAGMYSTTSSNGKQNQLSLGLVHNF
jgi:predicted porin